MKILDDKIIYKDDFFTFHKKIVKNGKDVFERNIIEKSDSMTVMVIDDETNKILIEKKCRAAVGGNTWGFPAGLINKNEDPKVTAVRELREETGLKINQTQLTRIGVFTLSEGFTNEKSHVFICHLNRSQTEKVNTKFDEDEDILEYKWVTLNSAKKKVHSAAANIAMLAYPLIKIENAKKIKMLKLALDIDKIDKFGDKNENGKEIKTK